MAFRADRPTVYDRLRQTASNAKLLAATSRAAMLAGPVSANAVRQLLESFITAKAEFVAAAAVPGIAAYAQAQEGDANYDVAAEFSAMNTAATNVINWIVNNMPKGASGHVLTETWSAAGIATRTFSTAETAGLRTVLDAFIATVS